MSFEPVIEFFSRVRANPGLQQELTQRLNALSDSGQAPAEMARFANEKGIAATQEAFSQALSAAVPVRAGDAELSEAELENVSGGMLPDWMQEMKDQLLAEQMAKALELMNTVTANIQQQNNNITSNIR